MSCMERGREEGSQQLLCSSDGPVSFSLGGERCQLQPLLCCSGRFQCPEATPVGRCR